MVIENPLMPPRLGVGTVPNIVPFTMRENFSQMGLVEGMRHWINADLIPFINANVEQLSTTWVEQANALIDAFEIITTGLVTDVNGAVAQIGDRVEQAEAAKVAAEAARDLAAQYASEAEEIQDVAVAGITGDGTSATRGVLDGLYASATAFDTIADIIDGRLSEASMEANFAAKDTQDTVETGRLSAASVKADMDASRGTVLDSDYASLELALAATPVNGTLEVRTVHARTTTFTVDKPVTINFHGIGGIVVQSKDIDGIAVIADNVTINDVNVSGAYGSVVGNGVGVRVTDCALFKSYGGRITGVSWAGMRLQRVRDSIVDDLIIRDVSYAGHMILSGNNISVTDVTVTDVNLSNLYVNGYGFAATRWSADSFAVSPNSINITYMGCVVRNNPTWEAFDTHGGINISWIKCRAINCRDGFAIVGMDAIAGESPTAAKNFSITDCYAESGSTAGDRGSGLVVAGVNDAPGTAVDFATGVVNGLTMVGFGRTDSTNQGGTYIHTTRGLVLNNLVIRDSVSSGLQFYHTNFDFSVNGVVVVDVWRPTSATKPVGIGFRSSHNQGMVSNAVVINTGKYNGSTEIDALDNAIRAWVSTSCKIDISQIRDVGLIGNKYVNPGLETIGYQKDTGIKFTGNRPTVSGSRGGNAALNSLLTVLAADGLITNNTVA